MSEPTRWSADQVQAVSPDASSLASARKLAGSGDFSGFGVSGDPPSLWGLCQGSGKNPYQTCIDLTEPAYRCSCPSRKFPCKHSLALLLMWSAGKVQPDELPAWVSEWIESRSARATKKAEKAAAPRTEAQERAAQRRAEARQEKVGAGVAELRQWLSDQVSHGIAGLEAAGYRHFEPVAARLVDAQAGGLASAVRRLAALPHSGGGWEERMLAELSMLHLLTGAAERVERLPEGLAAVVRGRLGQTVATEQVLATAPVRDVWQVVGSRDLEEERLVSRRVYLVGRDTGQEALVLSFAAPGQALAADLVVGTAFDGELCFYPGSLSLRALVAARHSPPEPIPSPAAGPAEAKEGTLTVRRVLHRVAEALAADPWLTGFPALVDAVVVPGERWQLADAAGDTLALERGMERWRFVAAAGGRPARIALEWGPGGVVPLTMFCDGAVSA